MLLNGLEARVGTCVYKAASGVKEESASEEKLESWRKEDPGREVGGAVAPEILSLP